jgi:hypothetical protein
VSQSIVGRMVLKDLYLNRFAMAGALLLGAGTLALAPFGRIQFYVGSVSFIVVLILLNIMTVIFTVTHERKEKVNLFILSLPISTTQYTLAKIVSSLIAFFVPYLVIVGSSIALLTSTGLPDGLIPYAFTVYAYVLIYFSFFLGTSLLTDSAVWTTLVIVFGNLGFSFLMPYVGGLPAVRDFARTETIVWAPEIVTLIAAELGIALVALAVFFTFTLRKKDFI